MSSTVTEAGLDWFVDRAVHGSSAPEAAYVAVGRGDTEPTKDDYELDDEMYRGYIENNNTDVYAGNAPGTFYASVIVSGGVEVDPDSGITELGLYDADLNLLYREIRPGLIVESGERLTFEMEIDFTNVEDEESGN